MSELLGLGAADGESRWIGVRRHQAVFAISGVGFIGEGLTHVRGDSIELVIGLLLVTGAVPTKDGQTVGERIQIAVNFIVRSRWTSIRVTRGGDATTIFARGEVAVRGHQLQHRGRLDLSGLDQVNALALAEFANAVSTADETRHFSLHVRSSPNGITTLLAAPPEVRPPSSWLVNDNLIAESIGVRANAGAEWLLERWAYVRDERQVVRILRIRDFSAAPVGHAALERMQFASPTLDVVVHVDVVGGARASRLAARAVHRVGSDDATSQAAGFRRTAKSSRALERLRQRESLVVEGTALLRVAVFIVVRSSSLRELRRDVKAVNRTMVESGLRGDPGYGRQALWFCAQLPGGPGW